MADAYRLDKLSLAQKQDFYKLLRARQLGTDPSTVDLPARQDGESDADYSAYLERALRRGIRAFERGGRLGDATREDDPTPKDQLDADYKGYKPGAKGFEKGTDNARFMELMAFTMYGKDVSLDGDLGNDEAALTRLSREVSLSPARIRASGEEQRIRAGERDATAKVDADAALEQNQMVQAVARAFGRDISAIDGKLGEVPTEFGPDGGKGHPIDAVLIQNQDAILRKFQGTFTDRNLMAIRNSMFEDAKGGDFTLTEHGKEVMQFLVQETDMRTRISGLLNSGDADKIAEAQALLKLSGVDGADDIKITGEIDHATATVGVAYIEQPRTLGEGLFRHTIADTDTDGSRPYKHEVATSVIRRNIVNGTLTINEDLLPEEFRKDLERITDPTERAREIANFLTDPKNLKAYNDKAATAKSDPSLTANLRTKLEGGELPNDAERLARRGALVDKFTRAAVNLNGIRGFERRDIDAMRTQGRTAGTLVKAGRVDEGIGVISDRVDSVLASLHQRRMARANVIMPLVKRMPGYENMTTERFLSEMSDPDKFKAFMEKARGQQPGVYAALGGNSPGRSGWQRLQRTHDMFSKIQTEIRETKPPVRGDGPTSTAFGKAKENEGPPLDRRDGDGLPVSEINRDRTRVVALEQ